MVRKRPVESDDVGYEGNLNRMRRSDRSLRLEIMPLIIPSRGRLQALEVG
jgi:hypothetical protein